MKLVRILIPIGTLVALFFGWVAARVGDRPLHVPEIAPKPSTQLGALDLPQRSHVVEGRVVDPQARAIADALVWLRAGDEPHWAYTDAEGWFHLGPVAAGPWPLVVVAHGHAPQRMTLTPAAPPYTIEIAAALAPIPKLAAVERSPLAGRIAADLVTNFADYEVVLAPLVPPETLDAPLPRRVRADREGRFAIDDLAHGEYRVSVLPPWARGGSWPDLTQGAHGGAAFTFVHDQHADGGAAHDLAIGLVSGEIRARLRSLSGDPLGGALVLVSPADDASRVWPPVSTGDDGDMIVRDLPAGSYRISIRAGSAALTRVVEVESASSLLLDFDPLDVGGAR